jgi:pSer/pThr/pTyr-binding forkhead associated (FHA) protein
MQPRQASSEQPGQRAQPSYAPAQPATRPGRRPVALDGPTLVILSSPREGTTVPVPAEGLTLGRLDQLGPPFNTDDAVSRKHAVVRPRGLGSVEVVDLGSTNGTYLNERKVTSPTAMGAGDVLRIGGIELRLVMAETGVGGSDETAIVGAGTVVSPGPGGRDQDFWAIEQTRPPSSARWPLSRDRLTIGRDPSADIVLDDPGASRHHADLVRGDRAWSIIDAGSANGTRVDGVSVREHSLPPGSRIEIGNVELVLRSPVVDQASRGQGAARYDIGSQAGNINNVAGNQANYYRESNLRYIASRRGRARALIVWGIILYLAGTGLGFFDVLNFDSSIFSSIGSSSFQPPQIPALFIPLFGIAALMCLVGIGLFIFGLITRSGAKREARRLGAGW